MLEPDGRRSFDLLDWSEQRGDYVVRFARDAEDRERVQRLRFQVFADELGATLVGAERGLDEDPLDAIVDHLLVLEQQTGECVGTYRLVTREQVGLDPGFYSQRLFEMQRLDPSVAAHGVELGRACVSIRHRTRGVFQLLLRGIGAYLVRSRKQFLFGCGSIPLKDPAQAGLAAREIEREGWIDPDLAVRPHRDFAVGLEIARIGARPEIPALLYAYCALGARLGALPAYDPDFRTLDFFVLLDLDRVEPRAYARYCEPR